MRKYHSHTLLYLHETIALGTGSSDRFTETFVDIYQPMMSDLGARLFALWETAPYNGHWPQVTIIWEIDAFADYARIGAAQARGGSHEVAAGKWAAFLAGIGASGEGRIMYPGPSNKTLAQLREANFSAAFVIQEIMQTKPGRQDDYIRELERLYVPWSERGGSIDNRSRFAREIVERVRVVAGGRVAVIAKLDMDDGLPGSIWIDEALRTAQLLDADGTLDAIELTQGSSVYKPMYLFRGDVPVREFARVVPAALRPGIRLAGKRIMGTYPYTDLYMLEAARQFVPVVRNTKLILLGGITNRDHLETGMREGFDFMAMGRALLREPDLVNKMMADPATRSRCTHNNMCMITVFGRTHCVLDPEQRYGPAPAKLKDIVATSAVSLPINS